MSKHLATAKRDIPLDDLTSASWSQRHPTGPGCATCSESSSCASRCAGWRRRSAPPTPPRPHPSRSTPWAEAAGRLAQGRPGLPDEVSVATRPPRGAQGALFADENEWRFGAYVDETREVIAGTTPRPEDLVAAVGSRPAIAHDAKSLGEVPENLTHDTEVAAYLLEPARRAYPFRELCEERGLAAGVDDEAGADAVLVQALAAWQREEIRGRGLTDLFDDVELPMVRILRDMEKVGVKLDTERLRRFRRGSRRRPMPWSPRSTSSPARSSRSVRPSSWRRSCSASSVCRASGAARPATPPMPACCRRSMRARDDPEDRALAGADKLAQTYLDALPLLIDGRRPVHTTFNQTAATTGRLSSNNPNLQNIPIRTPLGREIRACFVAEPGRPAGVGRLFAGGAAAARPHRRRGRAQGDLPARRGRPHGDGLRVSASAGQDDPGCARSPR